MSQINRLPRGLQDFLASQNFGDNPSELSQVVAPTLDLKDFYKAERRTWYITQAAVTLTAPAFIDQVTVPEGEMWIVEDVGCSMFKNAAWTANERVFVTAAIDQIQGSNFPNLAHSLGQIGEFVSTFASATSGTFFWNRHFPVPLIALGGDRILINASQVTVTTSNVSFRGMIHYTRLKV